MFTNQTHTRIQLGLYVRRRAGLKGDSFQVVAFFDGVLMLNTDQIDGFKLRAS